MTCILNTNKVNIARGYISTY